MKLIEEMKKALPPHVPVRRVKAWADALANSGALVPVPDGDPCKLMDCTAYCFIHDGKLFTISSRSGAWVSTHTPRQDNTDLLESFHFATVVQPIRLVPIAEWGAEG